MKRCILLLTALFAAVSAQAGSFGGPPPFSNGSPLSTGVDGQYSGSIRASNTVGVVRFEFSNNVQSATTNSTSNSTTTFGAANSYTVFSEGLTFTGPLAVSIANTSIAAVMERDDRRGFSNTRATGDFTAKLQQNSPFGSFKGNGFLQTFLEDTANPGTFNDLFSKSFRVKGVRANTGAGT